MSETFADIALHPRCGVQWTGMSGGNTDTIIIIAVVVTNNASYKLLLCYVRNKGVVAVVVDCYYYQQGGSHGWINMMMMMGQHTLHPRYGVQWTGKLQQTRTDTAPTIHGDDGGWLVGWLVGKGTHCKGSVDQGLHPQPGRDGVPSSVRSFVRSLARSFCRSQLGADGNNTYIKR